MVSRVGEWGQSVRMCQESFPGETIENIGVPGVSWGDDAMMWFSRWGIQPTCSDKICLQLFLHLCVHHILYNEIKVRPLHTL